MLLKGEVATPSTPPLDPPLNPRLEFQYFNILFLLLCPPSPLRLLGTKSEEKSSLKITMPSLCFANF